MQLLLHAEPGCPCLNHHAQPCARSASAVRCPGPVQLPDAAARASRASQAPTYEEIIAILKSQKAVKGIKIEIDAAFWGEEYAAGADKPRYHGVIDRWQSPVSEQRALMVQWEGYNRCQAAPLDSMDKAASGDSLGLKLLPRADGTIPTLQAARRRLRRR